MTKSLSREPRLPELEVLSVQCSQFSRRRRNQSTGSVLKKKKAFIYQPIHYTIKCYKQCDRDKSIKSTREYDRNKKKTDRQPTDRQLQGD